MTQHDPYNSWIEALESNDYPKSRGYLRTADGYCCLGVICDVINPTGWKLTKTINRTLYAIKDGERAYVGQLPRSVQKQMNIRTPFGQFDLEDLSPELQEEVRMAVLYTQNDKSSLAEINDQSDSFDLVIRILKEQPPSLFVAERVWFVRIINGIISYFREA